MKSKDTLKEVVSKASRNTVCWCFAAVALLGILEIGFMADYVRFSDAYVTLPLITFFLLVLLLKFDVRIPADLSRTLRETSILVYLLHAVVQGKFRSSAWVTMGKRRLSLFCSSAFLSRCLLFSSLKSSGFLNYCID